MQYEQLMLLILILLPIAAALMMLLSGSNYTLRNIITYAAGIILAVCSVVLLFNGPFEFQVQGAWNQVVTIVDFCLLAFIMYIGIQRRHALIILFAIIQILMVAYFEFFMGGGHAEVTPTFAVDRLAMIMAFIINIIGSLICIYGVKYIKEHEEHHPIEKSRQHRFMFWLVIFLGAMNGIVFSNNLYWMAFFWEATTLCSFQLIGHDLNPEAIRNACRALWMNLLGGAAFIGAVIYLFAVGSGEYLSIRFLLENTSILEVRGAILVGIALLVFAGMTKSAQLPFQSWLLGAMVAPTPVSALLHSSTMVKAGVYLVLRLAPIYAGTTLSNMVAAVGAFTFLITSFLAISQSNAKRVLAYSTIANLGLIVACAGINTPTAISAAIVLIIFHAVSKGLLFLCTGYIEHKIGSRDIEDMEGLADSMPLVTVFVTIGIISMFLPPFGMLVGKWAAVEAASELPVIAIMFVLASAVTALFWIKWLGRLLEGKPGNIQLRRESMDLNYLISLGGLSIGAVLLGIFITPLINYLIAPVTRQFYTDPGLWAGGGSILSGSGGAFVFWPLFVLLGLIIVVSGLIYKPRNEPASVYLCGENSGLPDSTRYVTTGEGVSELKLSNYYFGNLIDEVKWNKVVNVLAGLLILILLGVTVI